MRMIRQMLLFAAATAAVALTAAAPALAQPRFLVLAANRTSTMEAELNAAGAGGYRFSGTQGGETTFGGNEVVVVMTRDIEGRRFRYRLLATNRTGTMDRELNQMPSEFEVVGMTVFSSTFGGKESAVILEAEAAAFRTTSAPDGDTPPVAAPVRPQAVGAAASDSGAEPTTITSAVYLIAEEGIRRAVAPTVVRRVEEEGGGLFSQPRRFAIFAGVKAASRSSDHYQVFEIVNMDTRMVDDFVLVQLYEEPEYDERTLDVLPGGVNLDVVVPLRRERTDAGTYHLRPVEPLGLGEFALFRLPTGAEITRGLTVYEFGVDP